MSFRHTFFLAVVIALASSAHADDLTDLFPKLPASVFEKWAGEDPKPIVDPANRSKLVTAKAGDLEAVSATLGLRDVVVDSKNGYLRFDSSGDGEGTVFTMTFWKCADGSKLLGAAIESWNNVSNDTAHISFWRVRDGKLAEVTKEFLPDITLAKFHDKHTDKVKAAAAQGFRWWWKLPQKGTSILIEAPSLENMEEFEMLATPDHAYEGRWDGKVFKWVPVKPKARE